MGLLDKIQQGIGRIGTATGQMIDETRLQMDIMKERRRKDAVARDLGYLVYRTSQGATAGAGEQDALVTKITDIEKEIARLEAEARDLRSKAKGGKPPEQPTPPQPETPPQS